MTTVAVAAAGTGSGSGNGGSAGAETGTTTAPAATGSKNSAAGAFMDGKSYTHGWVLAILSVFALLI